MPQNAQDTAAAVRQTRVFPQQGCWWRIVRRRCFGQRFPFGQDPDDTMRKQSDGVGKSRYLAVFDVWRSRDLDPGGYRRRSPTHREPGDPLRNEDVLHSGLMSDIACSEYA